MCCCLTLCGCVLESWWDEIDDWNSNDNLSDWQTDWEVDRQNSHYSGYNTGSWPCAVFPNWGTKKKKNFISLRSNHIMTFCDKILLSSPQPVSFIRFSVHWGLVLVIFHCNIWSFFFRFIVVWRAELEQNLETSRVLNGFSALSIHRSHF